MFFGKRSKREAKADALLDAIGVGIIELAERDTIRRMGTETMEAETWQRELKEGDCFLQKCVDFYIFGRVLAQQSDIRDREMENYRYAECYSTMCTDGERGGTHIATVCAKLDPRLFELFLEYKDWEWAERIVEKQVAEAIA